MTTTLVLLTLTADKLGLTDPDTVWLIPAWSYKAALLVGIV